jgi:hypothetical protein
VFGGITCLNILTLRCPAQPGLEAPITIEQLYCNEPFEARFASTSG